MTLVAVAALIGGFGIFVATSIAEQTLTALGFTFSCGFAILTIATQRHPNLSLDERGVFGFYRNFWPRLVRWDEIESVHFYRTNNFHDGVETGTLTLKNAADETLLKLTPIAFEGAPPDFEARFVAELKRHLMGETVT